MMKLHNNGFHFALKPIRLQAVSVFFVFNFMTFVSFWKQKSCTRQTNVVYL